LIPTAFSFGEEKPKAEKQVCFGDLATAEKLPRFVQQAPGRPVRAG